MESLYLIISDFRCGASIRAYGNMHLVLGFSSLANLARAEHAGIHYNYKLALQALKQSE